MSQSKAEVAENAAYLVSLRAKHRVRSQTRNVKRVISDTRI